jgi:DNA polymerase-1
MLRMGVEFPIHTRFDIVETGRTSSSGPNVQNIRRLPGIRECFVPRDGWWFMQADYPGLELKTLAQVCIWLLGQSRLAEVLNARTRPPSDDGGQHRGPVV